MERLRRSLGLRVRLLRLRLNFTQAELSELVELSEEQISNIERGNTWASEMTVQLLAKALQVDEQALFDFSDNAGFEEKGGRQRRASRKTRRVGQDEA